VVVTSDLHLRGPSLRGWAFVPQEGNTLLSTLDAFLLQTGNPRRAQVIHELTAALVVGEI
jgi:hypothetical protein